MLTEEKRQNILRHFFVRNIDNASNEQNSSLIIRCSEGAFRIELKEDSREFIIFKNADKFADADFVPITDDQKQKDDAITALGKKLIFEAAKKGDVEYLTACLSAGASANEGDVDSNEKSRPLHYAAAFGKVEECQFLVNSGADIFAIDIQGLTPLQKAEAENNKEVVEFLVGETEKQKNQSYQHYSDQFNSSDNVLLGTFYDRLAERGVVIEDLYKHKYHIEKEAATLFALKEKYSFFCNDGKSNSKRKVTSNWEIGYVLNQLGNRLIAGAVTEGNFKLVKDCLNVGASANEKVTEQDEKTPFIIEAAKKDYPDLCQLLIENGANVFSTSLDRKDALIHAAEKGSVSVCKLLIKNGADVFAMDKFGKTAAYYANECDCEEDTKAEILNLIESKQKKWHEEHLEALKNIDNPQKILAEFYKTLKGALAGKNNARTFLHQNGRTYQISEVTGLFTILGEDGLKLKEDWEAYYVLRTFGSNLDKSDGTGKSFFFKAAQEVGRSEFIKACLDSGISVDEKDKDGKTALFYARNIGDKETIEILSAESVKKHKTPSFSEDRRKDILKTFLASKPSGEGKKSSEIFTAEGSYQVEQVLAEGKTGFVVSVMKSGEYLPLEGNELNCAIGDLGRALIFDAARLGNTELYKACIDAGASKDDVDENGNRPLTYAKKAADASKDDVDGPTGTKINSKGGREISHLIAGITKDPITEELKKPNKFRELAIKVREKYLANKEVKDSVLIAGVQAVIDEFAQRNPGFKLDGLTAKDMIVFMKDISIEGMGVQAEKDRKGVPYLDRKPKSSSGGTDSNLEKLLEGKTLKGEVKSDYERRKAFYPELLIDCLENTHGFLSQNRSDHIRQLIIDNAKKKSLTPKVGKSAGYSALNSVEKDSVAYLYMRARFEKLKKREGLSDNLTYEDFSKKLGDVVKVNFGLDGDNIKSRKSSLVREIEALSKQREGILKQSFEKAEEILAKVKEIIHEEKGEEKLLGIAQDQSRSVESRQAIKNYQKSLRDSITDREKDSSDRDFVNSICNDLAKKPLKQNEEEINAKTSAIKEIDDQENTRANEPELALTCLFGNVDKSEKNTNLRIAHGDLRIALNMMREDSDFSSAKIIKQRRDLEEVKAAGKLQKIYRGARFRRNNVDARDGKVSAVKKRVQNILAFELSNNRVSFDKKGGIISSEDYSGFYSKGAIEEVAGTSIYDGSTGLVIHKFSGSAGFRTFTDQVAEANRVEWADSDKVSIAYIEDMPIEGGVKKSFCIAVSSKKGATKIFSKTIPEISNRSDVVYEENLKFVTKQKGIEFAIDVLTDAKNALLSKRFLNEQSEQVESRLKEIVGQANYDDKEKKLIQETIKEEALKKIEHPKKEIVDQINKLIKCLEGNDVEDTDSSEQIKKKRDNFNSKLEEFFETTEGKNFKKILETKDSSEDLFINKKAITIINRLILGESNEEMRLLSRQRTSKQMQAEIALRVRSSKEMNNVMLNLDGPEIANVVASYCKNEGNMSLRDEIASYKLMGLSKNDKDDLVKLLKEEMPASAYQGISVFRPRGKDNIATVTFNGDYKGDDTMYLTLPDSPECYTRVFRCDRDGDFSFWKNGKKVTEARRKGDIIIDTGVVFHKGSNGKYEPMSLDFAADKFGREVKEAALDFKIKAISLDDGQRLKLATLYNGKAIETSLAPKTSPLQKVDSHKPEKSLESQDVIFKGVKNCEGKYQNLDENRDVELSENVTLLIGKEADESSLVYVDPKTNKVKEKIKYSNCDFESQLTEELKKLKASEIAVFAKRKFFKDCSSEQQEEINRLLTNDDKSPLAKKMIELIPGICQAKSKIDNTKYAAIFVDDKDFGLFVPVKWEGDLKKHPEIKFSHPVIQYRDKDKMVVMKIFNEKGQVDQVTRDIILEKVDMNFLGKFFSSEELRGYTATQFLKANITPTQSGYLKLCSKMKNYCEGAKVTVGYQDYEKDGFNEGKEEFKRSGKLQTQALQLNKDPKTNLLPLENPKLWTCFTGVKSSAGSGRGG